MDRVVAPLALKGKLRATGLEGQPTLPLAGRRARRLQPPASTRSTASGRVPANKVDGRHQRDAFAGDWQQILWCTRMDMTWELLTRP